MGALKFAFVVLALAALCVAVALVMAVVSQTAIVVTGWVAVVLQISTAVAAIGAAFALLWAAVRGAHTQMIAHWERIAARVDALERRYDATLRKIQRRLATGVSFLVVVGEVIILMTDGTFDERPGGRTAALVTAGLMTLGFALANEMLLVEHRSTRAAGRIVWLASLAVFPVMLMASRDWTPAELFTQFRGLPAKQQYVASIAAVLLFAAQFFPDGLAWVAARDAKSGK